MQALTVTNSGKVIGTGGYSSKQSENDIELKAVVKMEPCSHFYVVKISPGVRMFKLKNDTRRFF